MGSISRGSAMRVVTRTRTAAGAVCAAVVVAVTRGAGSTETLVERGAYLVTTVAACGNCHTPRDASGKPMANMTLAGGFEFDDGLIGHVVVPNITPDPRDRHRQMDGSRNRRRTAQRQAAGRDGHRAADANPFLSATVG